MVFCEHVLRSVPVLRCEACPFAASESQDGACPVCAGGVDCAGSVLPIARNPIGSSFPPAVAAALPVGLALVGPVVCVQDELPWAGVARSPVLSESLSGVPVVNGAGALVGLLPAASIALAGWNAAAPQTSFVADHAMSAATIHEVESLGDAFAKMGQCRLRELTVISDGLAVVGILRDLDALRFVAHVARTGARPRPERAARSDRLSGGPRARVTIHRDRAT
jgi:CBS domain-containing protein